MIKLNLLLLGLTNFLRELVRGPQKFIGLRGRWSCQLGSASQDGLSPRIVLLFLAENGRAVLARVDRTSDLLKHLSRLLLLDHRLFLPLERLMKLAKLLTSHELLDCFRAEDHELLASRRLDGDSLFSAMRRRHLTPSQLS